MRVAVTGANGFVGRRLVAMLAARGLEPVALVRRGDDPAGAVAVGDLAAMRDPEAIAARIGPADAFVHLAAKTSSDATDDDGAFWPANVDGALAVVDLAARTGCRRFVFVSTIKVHGDESPPARPLVETSPRAPTDAYGRSKRDAEDAVIAACTGAGMGWTVVRPPLVYGPGAGGNIAGLARLAGLGLPLPLGGVGNRRSVLFVDNLCDVLVAALLDEAARDQVFLVDDGVPVSLSDLLRLLARAQGKRLHLLPAPVRAISLAAKLLGRPGIATRLFGDLALDSGKARSVLGWTAPVSTAEGLALTLRR